MDGQRFSWWRKLAKHAWREPDPSPAELPDASRVALFGGWATGLYGAPVVSGSISSDPRGDQLVLHPGDRYYAGTATEIAIG